MYIHDKNIYWSTDLYLYMLCKYFSGTLFELSIRRFKSFFHKLCLKIHSFHPFLLYLNLSYTTSILNMLKFFRVSCWLEVFLVKENGWCFRFLVLFLVIQTHVCLCVCAVIWMLVLCKHLECFTISRMVHKSRQLLKIWLLCVQAYFLFMKSKCVVGVEEK